jgi:glucose-6-phosphate dehydrogenase assembly protein OpcA
MSIKFATKLNKKVKFAYYSRAFVKNNWSWLSIWQEILFSAISQPEVFSHYDNKIQSLLISRSSNSGSFSILENI